MKTSIKISIFLLIFLFVGTFFIHAQNEANASPSFEVHKVYPYISVSKTQLITANTLADLKSENNKLDLEFRPTRVSEYLSVEIEVCSNGELIKATSPNDILTKKQKDLLAKADLDKEIQVSIHYLPKNNLVQNDSKTIDFSVSIDPENSASFSNGDQALINYLDKTVIKFSINKKGEIHQSEIFGAEYQSGKFNEINKQLLDAIRNMPNWKPATFADGTTVEQDFVLTVGSRENCVLPLLNISR